MLAGPRDRVVGMMENRHLRQFVAVAETKSFTEAARRLGVVQSAVSLGIQALERELEAELIERTSRHVALTPAGDALLPYVCAALDALSAGRDAVRAVHDGLSGRVRIGAFGLADPGIASAIATFRECHSDVSLTLSVSLDATRAFDALRSRSVDLAFLPNVKPMPSGFEVLPLAAESMVALLPAGDDLAGLERVTLRQLHGREFVEPSVGHATRAAVDAAFLRARMTRNVTIEVADPAAVADFVRAGLGVAIVPASLIGDLGTGLVAKELRPSIKWAVAVAWLDGRDVSPAVATLIGQLRSTAFRVPA